MPPANRPPRFISTDGHRVEPILVQRSLQRPPRLFLRVTWRGYWLGDCATVSEVAALVPLHSLVEV